jgi:hypothetical protein
MMDLGSPTAQTHSKVRDLIGGIMSKEFSLAAQRDNYNRDTWLKDIKDGSVKFLLDTNYQSSDKSISCEFSIIDGVPWNTNNYTLCGYYLPIYNNSNDIAVTEGNTKLTNAINILVVEWYHITYTLKNHSSWVHNVEATTNTPIGGYHLEITSTKSGYDTRKMTVTSAKPTIDPLKITTDGSRQESVKISDFSAYVSNLYAMHFSSRYEAQYQRIVALIG